MQAGAGYGKKYGTGCADTGDAVVWYHLEEEDAEPLRFLAHLFAWIHRSTACIFTDASGVAGAMGAQR